MFDDHDLAYQVSDMSFALFALMEPIKTQDVWERFKDTVAREIEQEKAEQWAKSRRVKYLHELSRELWLHCFNDLQNMRIERREWWALNLEEKFRGCLLNTDIHNLVAVAETGFPGHFSNSVSADVTEIARSILESRQLEVDNAEWPDFTIEVTYQGKLPNDKTPDNSTKRFMEEISSHVYRLAIASVGGRSGAFSSTFSRDNDGELPVEQLLLFIAKLVGLMDEYDENPVVGIILRSFVDDEIHPITGFPRKDIRGYQAWLVNGEVKYERLSPDVVRECQSYDAKTGERTPLEVDVTYSNSIWH